jgi:hypothetical protein
MIIHVSVKCHGSSQRLFFEQAPLFLGEPRRSRSSALRERSSTETFGERPRGALDTALLGNDWSRLTLW